MQVDFFGLIGRYKSLVMPLSVQEAYPLASESYIVQFTSYVVRQYIGPQSKSGSLSFRRLFSSVFGDRAFSAFASSSFELLARSLARRWDGTDSPKIIHKHAAKKD